MNDDTDTLDAIVRLQARIARIDAARLLACTGTTAVDERLRDHLRAKRAAVTEELERLRAEVCDGGNTHD
jgi:hypothetical protein